MINLVIKSFEKTKINGLVCIYRKSFVPLFLRGFVTIKKINSFVTVAIFSFVCVLCWVGDESQIDHTGLLDMSLQSLTHYGDAFGDEDKGCDLLGSDSVLIWVFCHILAKQYHSMDKCYWSKVGCS